MAKSAVNPDVDRFLSRATTWRMEFEKLRAIILDCGLDEGLKWGVPCYMVEGKKVVLMHGFKDYCAVLFVKGALLKDRTGVLVQQTKNVQAARQIRFASLGEVVACEALLQDYVQEAVELEKSGESVRLKATAEFAVPEEFQSQLQQDPSLKAAFEALTPGRRRAYLLHFSSPKQAKTREARIEKAAPRILEGKGLDD